MKKYIMVSIVFLLIVFVSACGILEMKITFEVSDWKEARKHEILEEHSYYETKIKAIDKEHDYFAIIKDKGYSYLVPMVDGVGTITESSEKTPKNKIKVVGYLPVVSIDKLEEEMKFDNIKNNQSKDYNSVNAKIKTKDKGYFLVIYRAFSEDESFSEVNYSIVSEGEGDVYVDNNEKKKDNRVTYQLELIGACKLEINPCEFLKLKKSEKVEYETYFKSSTITSTIKSENEKKANGVALFEVLSSDVSEDVQMISGVITGSKGKIEKYKFYSSKDKVENNYEFFPVAYLNYCKIGDRYPRNGLIKTKDEKLKDRPKVKPKKRVEVQDTYLEKTEFLKHLRKTFKKSAFILKDEIALDGKELFLVSNKDGSDSNVGFALTFDKKTNLLNNIKVAVYGEFTEYTAKKFVDISAYLIGECREETNFTSGMLIVVDCLSKLQMEKDGISYQLLENGLIITIKEHEKKYIYK